LLPDDAYDRDGRTPRGLQRIIELKREPTADVGELKSVFVTPISLGA